MAPASCAIGIDIGGTHTRVGLVGADGALVNVRRGPTPRGAAGAHLLNWIYEAVEALLTSQPGSAAPPAAIGLAVPGALDEGRSMILRAVNLPFLESVPIRDELSSRVGLPVVLETDVAAAAWGEYARAGSRPRRFVFLAIGTGIGAAVILDGRIVRHTHGGAGHIGQTIVDSSAGAARGRCGTAGSLEACAAGPALERAAEEAGLPPSLADLYRRCQDGDGRAIEVVDRAARFLAIGLANVACMYAPDEIVVGGGAAGALPELAGRARVMIPTLAGDLVPPGMVVRSAGLGDDAGMIGAALLAAAEVGRS